MNPNPIEQAIESLELALPFMEEQATIDGYGFYRPANPHNFFPDPESCTEAEIENHRAACESYDEGKFVPDTSDGWASPNLHILKAPWGIGSYTDTIPELQAKCEKARATLTALREAVKQEPPYAYIYEWDGPFGLHQSTSSARYNGMAPNRSVPVWTTPQAPKAEPVLLSDAEIRRWWSSENKLEDMDMCKIDDFTAVVRAVEAEVIRRGGGQS